MRTDPHEEVRRGGVCEADRRRLRALRARGASGTGSGPGMVAGVPGGQEHLVGEAGEEGEVIRAVDEPHAAADERGEDLVFFFFQAEDGIRDYKVTGVQTCALPI